LRQNELAPAPGAKKARKRVGRGNGSRHGTYSGRGCKGQKSRSGGTRTRGFEGGQLPLIRRLPRKRGFTNIFRVEYSVVNLDQLNSFKSGSKVTPQKLMASGLVKSLKYPVKVLATGDIAHPLTVTADRFSAAARAKIEAAGGTVEETGRKVEKPKPEEIKPEEIKPEETKPEETKAEDIKAEKPKAAKPKADKPKAAKPKADKPKADKPKAEKPKAEKPKATKPKAAKPKAKDSAGATEESGS